MQLAILESIRNLKGYENSSSTEFGTTKIPVISMMNEWQKNNKVYKQDLKNLGGSMRLGAYESVLIKNTLIEKIYKKNKINERHRHRYEVNYHYLSAIKKVELYFQVYHLIENLLKLWKEKIIHGLLVYSSILN